MTGQLAWHIGDHVRGVSAESLLAEAMWSRPGGEGTQLMRPRHPGFDVMSIDPLGLPETADAKAAEESLVDLDGTGKVPVIGWDTGGRVLSESATHLGLVVLDRVDVRMVVGRGAGWSLGVEGEVEGRIWLVPSEVALGARPVWCRKRAEPGAGRWRYFTLEELEPYRVER